MRNRAILRLLLLAALLIVALAGCASQTKDSWPESLAHNAGGEEESDGIGGTGLQPEEGDGLGGTGIIGPITGFGSIIVNGMHIDYPPDVVIGLNGEPASTQALKMGRIVEVRAFPVTGELVAHQIEVLDAVIGPVEAVNRQDGSLRVLGQTVYLDRETVLASGLDIQNLRPGELLRVSGLHLADGALVATRIEPAEAGAGWFVTGLVRDLAEDGFSIGGLQVRRGTAWPDKLRDGRLVLVRGEQVDGRFLGKKLLVKPDTPFNGMVERLVIQGYPRPATHAGALRIGNLQMDMPADSAVKESNLRMPLIHQRIQLTVHIARNGSVHAGRMVAIRPAPAAAIGRLLPSIKRPAAPSPSPSLKWDRTPDQGVPKPPPLSDRLIRPPSAPIRRPAPLRAPSDPRQLPELRPPPINSRPPTSVVRPAISS